MTDRRKALGLGLAASALALSGRGKARAADALTIDPGGVKIDNLTVAKSLTVDGGTNLGNVSVNGAATLAMNENHIRLSGAGNHQHGLAYRSKFATIEPDGPVLWGYKGGALATCQRGNKRGRRNQEGGAELEPRGRVHSRKFDRLRRRRWDQ